MAPSVLTETISAGKTGRQMLPELVALTLEHETAADFLVAAVQLIGKKTDAKTTAVVRGIKGQWRTLGSSPADSANLPVELLAESLDSAQFQTDGSWSAIPLGGQSSGQLLIQQNSSINDPVEAGSLSAALSLAVQTQQQSDTQSRRAKRLEAILGVTANWNESRETDHLLLKIAETSTRLLNAERATIFLPDGAEIVGRPALGVEAGEIRIPAGTGVVGQVIDSGEPARVDADVKSEQEQIDRSVDKALGFETRSLICVPIVNSANNTIGAFQLINKIEGSFTDADQSDLAELASHAATAIENTRHVEQLVTTTKHVADQAADSVHMIGECQQIKDLMSTIERVANTDLAIMITGENGTGKEVVAQMIHYLSGRRDNVLVAVNCAAITETLLESELFGHEKGAFTDAHQARQGKFELADGGTLFLDEIGDMSMGGQAKLLRVLEEKTIVRVGGSTPIATSARVIAATNQNLAEMVEEKQFREDLFFRLNVLTIQLPPLRDRGDDIILLAEHFLIDFCKKARRKTLKISAVARKRLKGHNWPGNVRELRNMMERLAYLSQGDTVAGEELEFIISPRKSNSAAFDLEQPLTEATKSFQCQYIQQHIDRAGGNMTEAAGRLGLHRSNLYRKMRQLGMAGGEDGDE